MSSRKLSRLSRAADAAGGTGHDLHKVKVLFSAFNQPDERFCVAQSADHGRVDGPAADLNGEFLDPLQAADAGVADLLERRIGALCQTAEAASVTPPLVPKITPPPERMENGVSGAVGSRSANWIPSSRIMEASSLVVRTASMSGFRSG